MFRENYTIDSFMRRGYQDLPKNFTRTVKRKFNLKKLTTLSWLPVLLIFASALSYSSLSNEPRLNAQKKVDKKVKFLANELIELKKYETELKAYENQLRLRSELIDTVLNDISDFDYERLAESMHEEVSLDSSMDNGMGGGIEPEIPLIETANEFILPSEKRKLISLTSTLSEKNLLDKLDIQLEELKNVPLGLPAKGRLSSLFGERNSPFRHGRIQIHQGVDIAVDWRSPVQATANGVVTTAKWKGAYGNAVIIDHGNGLKTLYGHMTKISVSEGDRVCRGQEIGFVGSTGRSTGPHVHYEVLVNNKPKNPMPFVKLASYLNLL